MQVELSSAKFFEQSQRTSDKEFAIRIKDADWTKGLTVLCSLCLLFGVWGLGTSARGVQMTIQGSEALNVGHRRLSYEQLKLVHAAKKVERDFRVLRLLFYFTKFALSVALLAGAVIMLMKLPFARTMMLYIFGSAIGFHVAGAVLGCAMFIAISGQLEETSRMTIYKYAANMKDIDGIVNQHMNGVAFGTLIGTFIGLLLKAGVYVRMMLFLNTPFVRAVFDEDPYPEYDEMLGGA